MGSQLDDLLSKTKTTTKIFLKNILKIKSPARTKVKFSFMLNQILKQTKKKRVDRIFISSIHFSLPLWNIMFALKKSQADGLLSLRHKLQQSVERTVMEEKSLLKRNYPLKYYLRCLGNDERFLFLTVYFQEINTC